MTSRGRPRPSRNPLTRALVIAVLAIAVWLSVPISGWSDDLIGKGGDRITAEDKNHIKGVAQVTIAIKIAPMSKPNADGSSNGSVPADSAFTEVEGGGDLPLEGFEDSTVADKFMDKNLANIQKAIFKRIGITPCDTGPETLTEKDGEQDFIDKGTSEVLNPGGSRTTFGYFIRITDPFSRTAQRFIYFALFSYDKINLAEGRRPPLCATEFFLFKYSDGGNPLKLLLGLAIGSDGKRLDAVPLDLARVSNFIDDPYVQGIPVQPGPKTLDEKRTGIDYNPGCLRCHGGTKAHPINGTPQHTLPFPWMSSR